MCTDIGFSNWIEIYDCIDIGIDNLYSASITLINGAWNNSKAAAVVIEFCSPMPVIAIINTNYMCLLITVLYSVSSLSSYLLIVSVTYISHYPFSLCISLSTINILPSYTSFFYIYFMTLPATSVFISLCNSIYFPFSFFLTTSYLPILLKYFSFIYALTCHSLLDLSLMSSAHTALLSHS